MNKEQIYDEQISPLLRQIMKITQEHGISMLASFALGHDGEGPNGEDCSDLLCNTLLRDGEGKIHPVLDEANALIRRRGRPAPVVMAVAVGGAVNCTDTI